MSPAAATALAFVLGVQIADLPNQGQAIAPRDTEPDLSDPDTLNELEQFWLRAIISQIDAAHERGQYVRLPREEYTTLIAELATLRQQAKKRRPSRRIVAAAIAAIGSIPGGVLGNAAWSELVQPALHPPAHIAPPAEPPTAP